MGRKSFMNIGLYISVIPKLTNKSTTWRKSCAVHVNYIHRCCSYFRRLDNRCNSCQSLNSNMAATDVMKREIQIPVISFCQDTFNTLKSDGMKKTFSDVVSLSASCLQKGGVIAVPTDTIYGVACLAQNTEAVARIYEIKNRNFQNPVAISVGDIEDIFKWSKVTVSWETLSDLLPGPVTVVFERRSELNPGLNPHTNLIGIRIPNHSFIQNLAKVSQSPIALTSANISGGSSCLQVEEFENLWPKLDLVVDGGKLSDTEESRLGSTVVDLSVPGTYRIIRPGSAHKATVACLRDKHKLQETPSTNTSR